MNRGRLLGRITSQGKVSAQGGRAAAARLGNCGVDRGEARLRTELGIDADEERDMKRMTESRRDDLRKRGALRAARIDGAVRLSSKLGAVDAGDMTEFMNHGTLLCRH